jgi:protein-tyrosine phosphatase
LGVKSKNNDLIMTILLSSMSSLLGMRAWSASEFRLLDAYGDEKKNHCGYHQENWSDTVFCLYEKESGMVRVCFVCLGNICRSPTAEGIMLSLVEDVGLSHFIKVDSSGTSAFHVGEPADKRSRTTAEFHSVDLPSRARQFVSSDFEDFDYIVAMDTSNKSNIEHLVRNETDIQKVFLLCDFDSESSSRASVPDPYYGGPDGFEHVFQLCRRGCLGLLAHIRANNL